MGFHLHAQFTGAFIAKVWRIEHKGLCNLLFADAVRSHITESVYQGKLSVLFF
jgi:prepilin-type processing-associated H-X9-DG protein